MITVFTSSYNRAHTLPRLYDSLKAQTSSDFEWIAINDGSMDETSALFDEWIKADNPFPIRYEEVENGGKHRAINRGVQMAESDAFLSWTAMIICCRRRWRKLNGGLQISQTIKGLQV